jgi:NADH:ubiquinone oxidoreductase subunit C
VTEVLAHKGRALTPEETEELLRDRLGDHVQRAVVESSVFTLWISPDGWLEAARRCRDERLLAYDLFDSLFGIDARGDGFDVVAVLYSTSTGNRIALRARCEGGREAPSLPSIAEVYRGADWMERETYDMFGIDFTGHPGLEPRILTVENFEGWPLRKDFHLASRAAKPWPGVAEPVELDEEGNKIERERTIGDAPGPYELDKAMAEQAKRVNTPPTPAVEPEAQPVEAAATQQEAAAATATAGEEVAADAGSDEGAAGGDPAARAKAKAEERRKRQAEARAAKARARAEKAEQAEGGPAPATGAAPDDAPAEAAAEQADTPAEAAAEQADTAAEAVGTEVPAAAAAEQPAAGPGPEAEDADVDPRVAARRKRQAEARAARAKARADKGGGAVGSSSATVPTEAADQQAPAETAEPNPAEPTSPETAPAAPTADEPGPAETRPAPTAEPAADQPAPEEPERADDPAARAKAKAEARRKRQADLRAARAKARAEQAATDGEEDA